MGAIRLGMLICMVAIAFGRSSPITGKYTRRDGILVADLTPVVVSNMQAQELCPNACNFHGICQVEATSTFPPFCKCLFMWSGADCSVAACPNNCSNAGICNHSNGKCKCNPNLGGVDCSLNLLDGLCPENCNQNGLCLNSTCQCFPGWVGIDCGHTLCPNNCSFHGACVQFDPAFGIGAKCFCEPGFSGDDCGLTAPPPCPSSRGLSCSNHGYCKNSQCICSRGWVGPDCSQPDCTEGYLSEVGLHPPPWSASGCPNDCSCHGYCSCDTGDGEATMNTSNCYCMCEPSWGGEACDQAISTKVPFAGVPQPMPNPNIWPQVDPYLTPAERVSIVIAQQRQGIVPPPDYGKHK